MFAATPLRAAHGSIDPFVLRSCLSSLSFLDDDARLEHRKTNETAITVDICLDGTGKAEVRSTCFFLFFFIRRGLAVGATSVAVSVDVTKTRVWILSAATSRVSTYPSLASTSASARICVPLSCGMRVRAKPKLRRKGRRVLTVSRHGDMCSSCFWAFWLPGTCDGLAVTNKNSSTNACGGR